MSDPKFTAHVPIFGERTATPYPIVLSVQGDWNGVDVAFPCDLTPGEAMHIVHGLLYAIEKRVAQEIKAVNAGTASEAALLSPVTPQQ